MPRKTPRSGGSALIQERKKVGKLASRLVRPQTRQNYTMACRWFFEWLQQSGVTLGDELWELDETVAESIEVAWEIGKHRGMIGNLLSGLELFCPVVRGHLRYSWKLWKVWGACSEPCRAPPFNVDAVLAVAYYMWMWDHRAAAVMTCVAFSCFLRTMEFVGMQFQQVTFSMDEERCHLTLPRTKGVTRHGGVEGVVLEDRVLVRALRRVTCECTPGDFVVGMTAAHYRKLFDAAVRAVSLPSTFKPYSLRRGGATWHFRLHGKMSLTMEIGRWSQLVTARTYVNTALMEITQIKELSSPSVMVACAEFVAILARYAG